MANQIKISVRSGNYVIDAIPGDKSISHRAIILGSLAENISQFSNFLCSEDCLNTVAIFRDLGVEIELDEPKREVTVHGVGLRGLKAPAGTLDVGNSGTGIRLITGVLAGQDFAAEITGDESIQSRPMKRIVDPLMQMGARVEGQLHEGKEDVYPVLKAIPAEGLHGIDYAMPIASAQVKSAILFAGLYADSSTKIVEPRPSRNHTETMLDAFGADITIDDRGIELKTVSQLKNPFNIPIPIPADISSAAFFIVLGLICPGLSLNLRHVGVNPTRIAIVDVLQKMGGQITLENPQRGIEPYADIQVQSSTLQNIDISEDIIPFIIDEIPILSVAAMFAEGTLRVRGAEELRHKESDRIAKIVHLVTQFGGNITEYKDGFDIVGGCAPVAPNIKTGYDHRIAMSAVIASIASGVGVELDAAECIKTSFPNFFDLLAKLQG